MGIDAKVFIFIKPQPGLRVEPGTFKMSAPIYYITDLSPDRVTCAQSELFQILKHDYGFSRNEIEDLEDKLRGGSAVILDLADRTYQETPEAALIKSGVLNAKESTAQDVVELFYNKFDLGARHRGSDLFPN